MARRILLIDDDRLQFRITEGVFGTFRGEKFKLEWAPTYEEGLERLLKGEYAACLLDFQLGPRDGLALIREAVTRGVTTPIIFLTADTSHEVDTAALEAGAMDFIVKSELTPRSLERALRYALKLGDTLELLRERATRDDLTGLLNRREFDRLLAEEAERTGRFGHPLALVILDLDHFKSINDTYGHPQGDVVLRKVAELLGTGVRALDRTARIGGEEFAVILMETKPDEALAAAKRLVELVRTRGVVNVGEAELRVTVSAGVAALPGHAKDAATLIEAADRALYAAKHAGRDRAVLAS